MISYGKVTIIVTKIGLVGQKGKSEPEYFYDLSFSEHHGESGMGEQSWEYNSRSWWC